MVSDGDIVDDSVGADVDRDYTTKSGVIRVISTRGGVRQHTLPCLFYDASVRIPPLIWRHDDAPDHAMVEPDDDGHQSIMKCV